MIWPTVAFLVLSLLVAVLALNRFLSFKNQPNPIFSLVVVVAIYIPLSVAFLLPIDILSSNEDTEGPHSLFYITPKYILLLWRFDYWSAFVLMWSILPFFQEYHRSGEFTTLARVRDSIKRNLKFQLIVGSVGLAGLSYYFYKFGFHFQTFQSLLIALSHTYSLILSLWLMSHGLINIPKRRWLSNVNLEHQLEQLYFELPKIHDNLNDSTFNYKDICSTIRALENISGIYESIFAKQVGYLVDSLPIDIDFSNHIRSTEYTNIDQLTHSNLSKLNETLKNEATNYRSDVFEYNKAVSNISRLQDIIDSKPLKSLRFNKKHNFIKNGRLNYLIYVWLLPILNLIFALFLFGLSIIIIESEMLHSTKYSIINILLLTDKISSTLKFIISFIFFTYMVTCALISLTRIKIFKMYHLFPKNSNPVSVIFFTMYSNRLTIPLSYNFLTLLQTGKVHSQFNDFLGKSINLSILGEFFNENLPRIIIIPIFLTTFNIFDRIKRKFHSLDYFDAFESDIEDEDLNDTTRRDMLIKQGKSIIQRELNSNTSNNRLHYVRRNNNSNSNINATNIGFNEAESNNEFDDEPNQNGFFKKFTSLFTRGKSYIAIPENEETV